jgi:(S)-ureidoglycine aminohydrolase
MKSLLFVLFVVTNTTAMAAVDSLHAAVYHLSNAKLSKVGVLEKRQIISGTTLDVQKFEVSAFTLPAGEKYTSTAADSKYEQLIVVKTGMITLTVNDTTKTVGPGSLALILAGDKISFENKTGEPVTWYALDYQTKMENLKRGHDAGPSFIKDWKDMKATITPKGETRQVSDRPTSMFERFDVHATVLNNGYNSHDPHTHRAEELILMINGNSQFQIGQEKFQAQNGDAVLMSSKVLHAAQNSGDAPCGYYAIQWHLLKGD